GAFPCPARRSEAPLPRAFLVRRQLGGRDGLEALVGDRLPALDREAVGARGKTPLRSLDGRELFAEVVAQSLVELVLVEVGREVRRIDVVGLLAVVLVAPPAQCALDALALGRQELACAIVVHRRSVQNRRGNAAGRRSGRPHVRYAESFSISSRRTRSSSRSWASISGRLTPRSASSPRTSASPRACSSRSSTLRSSTASVMRPPRVMR